MRSWFRGGRRKPAVVSGAAGSGVPEAPIEEPSLPPADVVLVTRVGCHLCEQAEAVVPSLADSRGASLAVLDVDHDEQLRERYTAHVPVLFVRGQLVDYWRVDEQRLLAALDGEPVAPLPPL